MPRLRVVFDTNSYRNISKPDFEEVLRLERQHSILGMTNPLVAMELLAHLADPSDKAYGPSLATLRRLYRHAFEYNGSAYMTQFIAASDETAALLLFERHLPGRAEQHNLMGALIALIAEAKVATEWVDQTANLLNIRSHVAELEKKFADMYWQSLVLPLIPNADAWAAISQRADLRRPLCAALDTPKANRVAAGMFVGRTAQLLGVTVSESEREAKIEIALKYLLIPVRFVIQLLRKIVESGYDLSKPANANTFWDIEITFSTSRNARVYGQPIWLVTRDEAVLAAARSADATMVVHSAADYLKLLQRSTSEVQAYINECVARGEGS